MSVISLLFGILFDFPFRCAVSFEILPSGIILQNTALSLSMPSISISFYCLVRLLCFALLNFSLRKFLHIVFKTTYYITKRILIRNNL